MLRSAGSVTINVTGGGSLAYGSFYSSLDQTDGVTPHLMFCEKIVWYTDNANIILEQENATAQHPAIPSVIITAQQIR